jgi:1-pyrroline-4-hydroxy-2-carboxylate deaminase
LNRNDVDWKGYWPASVTPFVEGGERVDDDELSRLLRWYLAEGMHGILVNGSTGEWYLQTEDERRAVAELAVEELKGKVPVVIGCTTFRPRDTARLALHAKSIGADGVLFTPPPYMRPSPEEILGFYKAVSDAVEIPMAVYNWPPGTNVDIGTELASALADIPNVVAIKDSTLDLSQFLQTLMRVKDRVRVFGPFMSPIGIATLKHIGGDGFIGGGMTMGREQPEFFEAVWRGDDNRATEICRKSSLMFSLLNNPDFSGKFGGGQMRTVMHILGQPGGHARPPRLEVTDPEKIAGIRSALETAGLLATGAGVSTR